MKKVFMWAWVVTMACLSMAQHLEVSVDGGYGLGFGTALAGRNSLLDSNTWMATEYEEIYSPGGAGLKMSGEVTYFLNDNIGIMAASGYSMFGGYSSKYQVTGQSPSDTNLTTTESSYMPINIGVKFKVKMGIIEPYLYLAPGVYFPERDSMYIQTTATWRDTIKTTYFYELGWGVSAGIGAVLRLSEKVGVRLEITPTYAFARQSKYEKEQGGLKSTYIYKKDTGKFPDPPNSLTYYLHDAPRDSYSSVAVKGGVCFRIF